MKKNLMATAGMVLITLGCLNAQDYKLAKNTGRLEITEVNNVTIEGTAGNEIVFSASDRNADKDERAKGLRAINSLGLEDNTGLGLSVTEKGNIIMVQQLKKMDGPRVRILVPKGVTIVYSHNSPHGSEVGFKNVESEIEVSTVHNGVSLENVTGPLNIKTVHGNIDASLGANIKGPVSISSVHGHVDVAFPVTTKANLKLRTDRGELLVDPDFKIDIERTGAMIKYDNSVSGKINGGGVEISLSSGHGKVYLRKK